MASDRINIKEKLLEEMNSEEYADNIAKYISSILREQLEVAINRRPKIETAPLLLTLTAETQVHTITEACLKAIGALANRFVEEEDLEEMFLTMLQIHSDACAQTLQAALEERPGLCPKQETM